ncbi:MAG: right-handed parallel beta-helix repeat-containing protein [Chloroflexota bacterium]
MEHEQQEIDAAVAAAGRTIRGALAALNDGRAQRGLANHAMHALDNRTGVESAQAVAAETLARLERAIESFAAGCAAPALAGLFDRTADLAADVARTWSAETRMLALRARGRMGEAAQLDAELSAGVLETHFLLLRVVGEARDLYERAADLFAAVDLPASFLRDAGLPAPATRPAQAATDPAAWAEQFAAALAGRSREDRGAAIRAEMERLNVDRAALQQDRPENPVDLRPWLAAILATGQQIGALGALLTGRDGWTSVSEVPLRLPGSGRRYILAADGSGHFTTFPEAMAAIPSGATLVVLPGRDSPGALVAKTVDIIGEGPAGSVVIESDFQSVIPVSALGGSMRNVTVRNRGGSDRYGLWLTGGGFGFEECTLSSEGDAAVFMTGEGASLVFRRCVLTGPGRFAIRSIGGTALLEECRLAGCAESAVAAAQGSSLRLFGCEVAANHGAGVHAGESAFVELNGCVIEGHGGPGIVADRGSKVWAWNSTVAGNGGPAVQAAPGSDVRTGEDPVREA